MANRNETLEEILKKKMEANSLEKQEKEKLKWKGITITIRQEERFFLESYAKENYKSFSGLVREITMKYIQKQEQ